MEKPDLKFTTFLEEFYAELKNSLFWSGYIACFTGFVLAMLIANIILLFHEQYNIVDVLVISIDIAIPVGTIYSLWAAYVGWRTRRIDGYVKASGEMWFGQ